jgi:hypothetical protein
MSSTKILVWQGCSVVAIVVGGLWASTQWAAAMLANIAVIKALSCFDLESSQIQVLSTGTGNQPNDISLKKVRGGWFQ